jgi:glycolate oxidase FAD binding subunit
MTSRIEHIPTDMTATVQAEVTLAALQTELAKGGQWLPIDPPFPERVTVGEILSRNLNGPRRYGYGTIRDYAIGMSVRLADGRLTKSGGKVVKNVAGYDLQKLFIGAADSLGTIVEANFKLRPLPELEQFVGKSCQTLTDASTVLEEVLASALTPTVLDLHNVNTKNFCLVLGFDGAADEVNSQVERARQMGFLAATDLGYEREFQTKAPEPIGKMSVLPSKLIEIIAQCGTREFVARAGNGILYARGLPSPVPENLPAHLIQRVREIFDPKGTLAPLPL